MTESFLVSLIVSVFEPRCVETGLLSVKKGVLGGFCLANHNFERLIDRNNCDSDGSQTHAFLPHRSAHIYNVEKN